ncbi:hypothetical protein ACM26V_07040 [Salipaludibacillus sp. HK11]|uniref:hypothetical protein n=1 Tax=Salipaludibacillus sp. HK11 TaxID=3394320 RepID=UPI0039FBF2D2
MNKEKKNELLAALASHSEAQLNDHFKRFIDDPKTINVNQLLMKKHLSILEKLRKHSETLALQLNLPTKDDVARVANLTKQLEEKLDKIEEQLHQLNENVEKASQDKVDRTKYASIQ